MNKQSGTTPFAPDRLRRGYAGAICVNFVVVSGGVLLITAAGETNR